MAKELIKELFTTGKVILHTSREDVEINKENYISITNSTIKYRKNGIIKLLPVIKIQYVI